MVSSQRRSAAAAAVWMSIICLSNMICGMPLVLLCFPQHHVTAPASTSCCSSIDSSGGPCNGGNDSGSLAYVNVTNTG